MKPFTINYDVVLIILSSFIILIAARDIIVRKDKRWYKRISFAGWALIFLAFGSGIITWKKIQSDNSDKLVTKTQEKKSLDSSILVLKNSVDEAFKKHDASFNPVTKTIIINKEKQTEKPTVYLSSISISQLKKGFSTDTLPYSITFKNSSSDYGASGINIIGYGYNQYQTIKHKINICSLCYIPKNDGVQYSNFMLRPSNSIVDTIYIYITGNYNNGKSIIDEVLLFDIKNNKALRGSVGMRDDIKRKISKLGNITD
jgi:hypothetical protein